MANETEGQQESNQQAESTTVTKERFDEVNAKLAAVEETNALLQQNMALAAANANAARMPQQPTDEYEAAGINISDPDNDVLTVSQQRKLDAYRNKVRATETAELHFKLDHPDFALIVGTPEQIAAGQYAKPLQDAIKDNPTIGAKIGASANPRAAAYSIAKLYSQRSSSPAATAADEASAVIKDALAAADRPGSASAASGQAGLDQANTIRNESDADFEKRKQAVIDGA